jgi:hypothetical protein
MSDKFLRRSPRTAARALGDDLIVLSVVDSTLFSLNEVARLVWDAADGRTPLRDIVSQQIVPRFEVDAEIAYRDALRFVEEIAKHGIIEVSDEPSVQDVE